MVRLWTMQDAHEHLYDVFGDVPHEGRYARHIRRAVVEAYDELPSLHQWKYYRRRHILTTDAAVTDGSVEFSVATGELTLTGGTWPSWAGHGMVRMGGVDYEVSRRVSDTVLNLEVAPPHDIAAGTSYLLFRCLYPLPPDFRRLDRVFRANNRHQLESIDPGTMYAESIYSFSTSSWPWSVGLRHDGKSYATMSLELGQRPGTSVAYGFLYEASPRQIAIEKYSLGTVAISGTTATLTGGTFAPSHAGAILRVSYNQNPPTGRIGSLVENDNPIAYETIIMEVVDDTTAIVDVPATFSGLGFYVSDPLDMPYGPVLQAFWRLAEMKYAEFSQHDSVSRRYQKFWGGGGVVGALDVARDADRQITDMQSANIGFSRYRAVWGDVDGRPS